MATTQESSHRGSSLLSYHRQEQLSEILESPYVVHLFLSFAVFMTIAPILWAFVTSIATNEAVYTMGYFPDNPTLQTYYGVLIQQEFWKAIRNSLIISIATTFFVLLFATPAGYAFSRYRFTGDSLLFIAIIGARIFPPIGYAVPFYELANKFGLTNQFSGIILAEVFLWLPLMIYILRNFFLSVPASLEESALIDGCTEFQSFRKIAVPLAMPGIAAAGILTFLYTWREFLFAFLLTADLSTMPVSVAAYRTLGDVNVAWASMAAASVLAIIPSILIVVFFQQYIVSGLTAGAMKGE